MRRNGAVVPGAEERCGRRCPEAVSVSVRESGVTLEAAGKEHGRSVPSAEERHDCSWCGGAVRQRVP